MANILSARSHSGLGPADVIVIGGGPAGLFAAGFAALEGADVLLLEKNRRCGAKLLLTGKGRCNLTTSEADARMFAAQLGGNGKDFLTALYAFKTTDTIEFFEKRGLSLQTERGGRVFPSQGGAAAVLQVLEEFLRQSGVRLITGCEVTGLELKAGRFAAARTRQGVFPGKSVVLATGGLSYPETGCSGDGYGWATATGHAVINPEPALVAVRLAENWTAGLADFNLKNVRITAFQAGRKIIERFGEAFFTRSGIGGPIILDMSSAIREALKEGPVVLHLDLKPAVDAETFDRRLQRELAQHANRNFGNSLGGLLPKAMIPLFIRLSGIDAAKKCHSITREERFELLRLCKELPLQVTGCEDFRRAIVTSGGVSLQEVDMRSMGSRRIENLYFAGEMIDLQGPTGGFNLQICWSTGYLAGLSAARRSLEVG